MENGVGVVGSDRRSTTKVKNTLLLMLFERLVTCWRRKSRMKIKNLFIKMEYGHLPARALCMFSNSQSVITWIRASQ